MKKRVSKVRFMKSISVVLASIVVVVAVLVAVNPAFAATKTWDGGGGNNNFSTAANWSGDSVPVNGDALVFDATGLTSDVTLNNDLTGLSLTGITFAGVGDTGDYILTGNAVNIQGTIGQDAGDFGGYRPQIQLNLNFSGNVTVDTVEIGQLSTITMNGHNLTLTTPSNPGNFCGVANIGAAVNGNGAIQVLSGTGSFGGGGSGSSSFTGPIIVGSGAHFATDSALLDSAASLTSSGDIFLSTAVFNGVDFNDDVTIDTPMTLSGQFRPYDGSLGWTGCNGDGNTGSVDLHLPNNFWLNGDLDYRGGDVDTIVTGSYITYGHALTTNGASVGTITLPAEDTAPGAPTGLSATPSSGQVALAWTAPASNGGQAISDYAVEYKLAADSSWTVFADGTSTSTTATVTSLTNGSSYNFRIKAVNIVGQGTASSVATATPATAPSAPTAPSAVSGNNQATVSFTAPASDGGSAITSYTVTSSPGGFTGTGSASPIVVTGLTNGTSYTFTVTATNPAGTSSASAASAAVTPAAVPGAPTGVTATPGNGTASVAFTAPAANGSAITSYTVTSSPGGFTGTGSASPIVVSGLTNGTAYTFSVVATNGVGAGAASSASSSVVPATVAGAPTSLVATPGQSQIALSWTAPASNGGSAVTDYVVQYKLTSSGSWLTFADGASTATSATVTGLVNGSSYDVQVLAVNSIGQSAPVTSTGITPVAAPTASDAVTNLIGTPGSTQVALTWTAPASNGGSAITDYVVEYKLTSSGTWLTFADGTSTTASATVTGLVNASSYDFRVAAVNGIGQSAYTTITGVTPAAAPTAPAAPTQLGVTTDTTNGHLVVGWTAPASNGGSAITDYLIEIRLSGTTTWTTVSHGAFTGTSFDITTGLTSGQTYDIRVSAINAQGTGPSVTTLNYLYVSGVTQPGDGDLEEAGGIGVGAPNTGAESILANPFLPLGFGVVAATVILGLGLRHRSTKR